MLRRLWDTDPELVMALSFILVLVAIASWQQFRAGEKLHDVTRDALKIVGGIGGVIVMSIIISVAVTFVAIIVGGLLDIGR